MGAIDLGAVVVARGSIYCFATAAPAEAVVAARVRNAAAAVHGFGVWSEVIRPAAPLARAQTPDERTPAFIFTLMEEA
jgi:hypothetical protein